MCNRGTELVEEQEEPLRGFHGVVGRWTHLPLHPATHCNPLPETTLQLAKTLGETSSK